MRPSRAVPSLAVLLLCVLAPSAASAAQVAVPGRIGLPGSTTGNGRSLKPAGQLTTLGNFPSGSALSPDGRFVWAVDSGHGKNDVKIVNVSSGKLVQTLPLPGGSGGIAFSRHGTRAFVSGIAKGSAPADGETKGDAGDVVHVFGIDTHTGKAKERAPFDLSGAPQGGTAQTHSIPRTTAAFPQGAAMGPDNRTLAVVLSQADQLALIDVVTKATRYVKVGQYPFGVAFHPGGGVAYVSNEGDGTISEVDTDAATPALAATITGLGGPMGDRDAHPEGLVVDGAHNRLFAAVANRDTIAEIDLGTGALTRTIDVGRTPGLGTSPVAVALAPDGRTLYTANAGEDAIAVVSLVPRAGKPAGSLVGRIPTAAYPTDVHVTPDGRKLVWIAGKGLGSGPNPGYQFYGSSPYGTYVPDLLLGRAGVLAVADDDKLAAYTDIADVQVRPANTMAAPAGTPLRPGGPIKHVFYVVRENRTYDQIFGSEGADGEGDPALELFDDNGVAGPTGGVTPNAHALAAKFGLVDHLYANSEVSVDGHIITAGAYANAYVQRALHSNYSDRGRAYDFGIFPITFPPKAFIFDQAARQDVTFRDYGEVAAGNLPTFGDDGRPTYPEVVANTDFGYPNNAQIGCPGSVPPGGQAGACSHDAGTVGATHGVTGGSTPRIDVFKQRFDAQLAAGTVPSFNYFVLPNDHTNGTRANRYTPQALMADNDLGLGQLVELISHSSIWHESAIFVIEDDSQDGADHIDAHRMPAFVISPFARKHQVLGRRFDQLSVLRSIELALGLEPLSLFDGLATPMYDAFRNDGKSDVEGTRYTAIQPEQSITELNPSGAALAGLSAKLPFDELDLVPQAVLDRILWASAKGRRSRPPAPGPNASPAEHERAVGAMAVLRRGGDVRDWLKANGEEEEEGAAGGDGD